MWVAGAIVGVILVGTVATVVYVSTHHESQPQHADGGAPHN